MKMDNATNHVQGTMEVNHFPPVEWEVITRRSDVVLEGLVVVFKWTGIAKIWILAALVEEVRLHLIITGVCCLEIALWETVLLRLS